MKEETKTYISGPMTGYPDHNFPAFFVAADKLNKMGKTVVNPAELDLDEQGPIRPWSYYLRRDLKILLDCHEVVALKGWEESKGASLEVHVAKELGMAIFIFNGDELVSIL